MSETTGKIYEAIPAILADVESIGKNRKNQQQGFNFRGIDDVYNAVHPLLAKHKVFPTCRILESTRAERETKNGGVLFYTTLKIEYTLWAADGSSVKTEAVGEAMDSGDKSHNKAMSAAYKYALFQLLCIPTEAVDPDQETHEVAPAKATRKTKEKAEAAPAPDDKTPAQRFADASTAIAKATDPAKLLDLAGRCKIRKTEGVFTSDMLQSLLETAYSKAIDLTVDDKEFRSVVLEDIVKTCNAKLLSDDVMSALEDRAAAKTAA